MPSSSSTPGGDPDFSFLGDQSLPDPTDVPDFEDAPSDRPNVSGVGDADETPDFSTDDDSAPVAEVPPVITSKEAPKARSTKRLKPKAADTPAKSAPPQPPVTTRRTSEAGEPKAEEAAQSELVADGGDKQSPKALPYLAAYAAALTMAFLWLLLTGRISLSGKNLLESLPDVEPLRKNEFRLVPTDAELPAGHTLNLGESQQFGDVVLTPFKITREQLTFVNMINGAVADGKVSKPVLKLWFRMTNASPDIAFPPWGVALMSHRSEKDEATIANSWLMVKQASAQTDTQVLNYNHPPDSNLDLADQHSRQLLNPGQELTSFIACSETISMIAPEKIESYRWRIQIRKGVHLDSGHGVTTLVDVNFSPDDIDS